MPVLRLPKKRQTAEVWESLVNERSNRILRRFIPKGVSLRRYTDEQLDAIYSL